MGAGLAPVKRVQSDKVTDSSCSLESQRLEAILTGTLCVLNAVISSGREAPGASETRS